MLQREASHPLEEIIPSGWNPALREWAIPAGSHKPSDLHSSASAPIRYFFSFTFFPLKRPILYRDRKRSL